jgi:hypothetical protein
MTPSLDVSGGADRLRHSSFASSAADEGEFQRPICTNST